MDGVIGGFLNALIDNPVTETVIMGLALGRELEELVGIDLGGVGGLVGLVAVAPGAFWLVAGGVIIPMTVGELPFGVRHRTMEQHEWDWAARVFGASLPPREQIEITNLRGLGNKAFVSVRTPILLGGKTTYYMHIGDQAYESPTTDTDNDRPVPGQLFMHELAHVWDAYHSGPDWMLNAICENRNPPLPSPEYSVASDRAINGHRGIQLTSRYKIDSSNFRRLSITGQHTKSAVKTLHHVSEPQHGDSPYFTRLLDTVRIRHRGRGRPRTRPGRILADKAYSARRHRVCLRRGITTTIPKKENQKAHRRAAAGPGVAHPRSAPSATSNATPSNAPSTTQGLPRRGHPLRQTRTHLPGHHRRRLDQNLAPRPRPMI
ncbi:MAG: hypothetical protein ACT4NY_12730 [Pseudonocardiales bacterium]